MTRACWCVGAVQPAVTVGLGLTDERRAGGEGCQGAGEGLHQRLPKRLAPPRLVQATPMALPP